ncbi:hypothetical protein FRC18_002342 [Serendipita sp. 400]|nr:hypothetical protein FRC18_002342 [Serendipita sp. 400]
MSLRTFYSAPAAGWANAMNTSTQRNGAKKREPNENKITAPAGREVIIPSRRVHPPLPLTISKRRLTQGPFPLRHMDSPDPSEQGFTAGGGAGNAFKLKDQTEESQKEAQELLAREREVLEKHKTQTGRDFKTGRGGLGAKGHVKLKGIIPNRERALEKERIVKERWKEQKDATGGGSFGRGGFNVIKPSNVDSDSKSTSSKSKSSSGRGTQKMFYDTFIVSSEDRRRRRDFSSHFTSSAPSLRSTHPYSQSSRSNDNWERMSTSDSIYDIEASTGITTSVVDPAVVLGAMSPHAYASAASTSIPRSYTDAITVASRRPSDVAPFTEPLDVNRHANIQRKVTSNSTVQPHAPTTPTAEKPSKSIMRSLKGLTLTKPKGSRNVVTPGSTPFGARRSSEFFYTNFNSGRPSASSAASFALQMVDLSHRELARMPTDDGGRQLAPPSRGISTNRSEGSSSKASLACTSTASTSMSTTSSMSSAYNPPSYPPPSLPSSSNVTIVAPPSPVTKAPLRRSRPLPIPPVAPPTPLATLPVPPVTFLPPNHGLPSPLTTP